MGKTSREEFLNKTAPSESGGSSGKWLNIKKAGKVIGFINRHEENGGLWERKRHGSSVIVKPKEKGQGEWTNYYAYNCAGEGCPLCLLSDFAKRMLNDGAEPYEIILSSGTGRDAWQVTLNDLIGKEYKWRREYNKGKDPEEQLPDPNWKGNIVDSSDELVVAFVATEPEDDENPLKIFSGGSAVLFGIQKIISSTIEDEGDDGDPLVNPYAFKITYNKDAKKPADYYDVQRASGKLAKLTKDIEELIDADPTEYEIDLDSITSQGNPVDMLDALKQVWQSENVTFEEFEDFYEKKSNRSTKSNRHDKKQPPKQTNIKKKFEPVEEGNATSRKCNNCGAEVGVTAKFCESCGEDLPPFKGNVDEQPNEGEGTYCEACDEYVKVTKSGRCRLCGKMLSDVPL